MAARAHGGDGARLLGEAECCLGIRRRDLQVGLPAECWACEEKLVWLEMPERPGQQKDPYCVCDRCGTVSSAGGVVRDGDELLGVVLSTMSAGVV